MFTLPLLLIGLLFLSKQAQANTEVGGIINKNTTWTVSNSPYIVIDTIQIPEGIVLTIEPDVVIQYKHWNHGDLFLVNGSIIARGTAEKMIIFDMADYNGNYFGTTGADMNTIIDLDYTKFKGGKFYAIQNGATLNLNNSILLNVEQSPEYFPGNNARDIRIVNNKFINSNALGFYNPEGYNRKFNIENNLFYGCYGSGCINSSAYKESLIVKNNSFINPQKNSLGPIVIWLSGTFDWSGVTAENNYWGTTNENEISDMIYDNNDSILIKNKVKYNPILNQPHPDTPKFEDYIKEFGTCTSWDYSHWSGCSDNKKIRSVIKSYPENCIGGNPILEQNCQETCTTFYYSDWSECKEGQQTRTIFSSLPKNCSGGEPIISKSCQLEINKNDEKNNITNVDNKLSERLKGRILLQVEAHGEAYYIYPKDNKKYYMANGIEAYRIMRLLGVGITDKDLNLIKENNIFAKKHSGKIFLQIESRGEAFYIDINGNAHYLKDGNSAYDIMRNLGLGITNSDLNKIKAGNL